MIVAMSLTMLIFIIFVFIMIIVDSPESSGNQHHHESQTYQTDSSFLDSSFEDFRSDDNFVSSYLITDDASLGASMSD